MILDILETVLEGKYRPGHFQGVCMVMDRLLEIVIPDNLYLGQKDYQQCMVIKKLIELIGLKDKIKVNICPTLREADGLAMSSRNTRLLPDEEKMHQLFPKPCDYIKENLKAGDTKKIKDEAKKCFYKKDLRLIM